MAHQPRSDRPTSQAAHDLCAKLSAAEVSVLDDLSKHDREAESDLEAQRVAADVADEVRMLVTYAIVEGDVASLERLAERLRTPGMDQAIRIASIRAGR
jgi:hypothetical protein